MSKLPPKFHSNISFQASDKKKTKHLVFIYLVTQNHLYSKNLQLKPNILWFYCIELFKRIPKHQDLLFYEFSMNWSRISKFTEKYYKAVPKALLQWVWAYSNNPLGFCFFHPEVPGPGQRGEAAVDRRFPGEGLTGGEGGGVCELHGCKAHLWVA